MEDEGPMMLSDAQPSPTRSGIVFFDGVCGICNTFIDFLLKIDHNDVLKFASLQGETASHELAEKERLDLTTVIFKQGDKTYYKSEAVLRIFSAIGGIWKLAMIFMLVPAFIRDFVYRTIASHRYKWFGKKEVCRIPTKKERGKLLN